ncbi:MAG: hypothetical protein IJL45_06450 [Prevotella sp.]|nr:hypothetical protein [Prevotella sp.]
MRKIIPFTLTLLLLPLLLSCGHGGYRATLNHIDTLLRTDPSTALAITDSLSQYESNMSRAEQMRTRLYRGVARIRTYKPVTDDSTAKAIAKYYDSHGTPNDRMMAYYLLGCTYRDLGDTPMQLECFQTAVERADTTRADCDYYTMVSIYGHMANLYDKQILPEEELKILKLAETCARKDNDTLSVFKAFELRMRPYYLLLDTNKVLSISDTIRAIYSQHGYNNIAAELLITPISIFLDRGQYDKTRELIDIYERESKLFDEKGNIQKGREYHYYNKGRYLLGIGKTDSAICYFYKALAGGIEESACKGLLYAYKKLGNYDSIAKYAQLFVNANDSSWFAKNSQTVEQMTAMYNYSRHKKQAEENAVRAEHAERIRTRLFLLLLAVIFISAYIYNKVRKAYKKKMMDKEKELHALEDKYMEAMDAYTEANKDIRLLKLEYVERMQEMNAEKTQLQTDIQQLSSQNDQLKDNIEEKISALNKLENDIKEETSIYKSALEEKNETIEKLRNDVISLTKTIKAKSLREHQREFLESDIYSRIQEVLSPQMKAKDISTEEWRLFTQTFCRCYPDFYTFLNVNSNLTPEQMRVCMLLKIGLSEGDMSLLLNVNNMRITRLKTQVNKKLFGEENAKRLRNNLKSIK